MIEVVVLFADEKKGLVRLLMLFEMAKYREVRHKVSLGLAVLVWTTPQKSQSE
jgi:hypothetical protein